MTQRQQSSAAHQSNPDAATTAFQVKKCGESMILDESRRPVLFLDFDDVLCLNKTCGGYDVAHALSQVQKCSAKLEDFSELWRDVFEDEPKELLASLDAEFAPTYVLSTSWSRIMNRAALVAVLQQTGIGFVANNLQSIWETIKSTPVGRSTPLSRAQEIALWCQQHPQFNKRWVVLDDEHSGTGLVDWPAKEAKPFIVLCKVNQGLRQPEFEKLRQGFLLRISRAK